MFSLKIMEARNQAEMISTTLPNTIRNNLEVFVYTRYFKEFCMFFELKK